MVLIPAGEFIMGTDQPLSVQYERPAHTVYLDAFYLDKYEVTAAQYADFLNVLGEDKWACEGTRCKSSSYVGRGEGGYEVRYQREQFPIEVTWHGAFAYCKWLGKRLPTEAEWEKAARGTDGRLYPWGNEEMSKEATGEWSLPEAVGTHPVDESPYGLFDMFGNAAEWTADWYDDNYYTDSPSNNPTGPEEPVGYGDKSVRSGLPSHYKITQRRSDPVDSGNGFRCAVSP
jgi:formylglycine-generating enzyme required for sulfatase activity